MFKNMREKLEGIFGAGTTFILGILFCFSLPICAVPLGRWFGMPWWIAIPLLEITPLSNIILFFPGIYFLYQANFNIDDAMYKTLQSSNRTELIYSPNNEKDLQTLRAALYPKIKQNCVKAFDNKEHWTDLIVVDREKYCKCYVTKSLQVMTLEEANYQYKHKVSSKAYDDEVIHISISCNSE